MRMLGTRAHNHWANSVLTMNIVQGFALTAATIFSPPESTHNSSTESIPTEKWIDWPLVQPLEAGQWFPYWPTITSTRENHHTTLDTMKQLPSQPSSPGRCGRAPNRKHVCFHRAWLPNGALGENRMLGTATKGPVNKVSKKRVWYQ